MSMITCVAPVNIAVIKYWGKRDEKLILPLNDSISATLNVDEMHAKTTVMASPYFKEDKIWLNGKQESFLNLRLQNCLQELRNRANSKPEGEGESTSRTLYNWHIHVCSENNFPTAAGLASSAAGYACLVNALAHLYKVSGDTTALARRGSGSACRSLLGGFVHWHRGTARDGSDSVATQVVPASHWPELRILILVISDKRKKISSSSGMKKSVETSTLLKHRVSECVPKRSEAILKAIKKRDFETFAEMTMKDSNQFHAICLDTYPPNIYMNDTSHAIVNLIHTYNTVCKRNKVAYTFDAGPNACLFLPESEVTKFVAVLNYVFPPKGHINDYFKGIPIDKQVIISREFISSFGLEPQEPGQLKYIILTKLGTGPQLIDDPQLHLLNETGFPK